MILHAVEFPPPFETNSWVRALSDWVPVHVQTLRVITPNIGLLRLEIDSLFNSKMADLDYFGIEGLAVCLQALRLLAASAV